MEDMNKANLSCIPTVFLHCRLQQHLGFGQIFFTKTSSHPHRDKSECITWTMPSDKVPEDQEVALSSLCLSSSLSEGQELASFSVAVIPFESSNSSALACEQRSSDIPSGNAKHCKLLIMFCSASALFIYLYLCFPNPTSLLALQLCCKMNGSWMTLIVISRDHRIFSFITIFLKT